MVITFFLSIEVLLHRTCNVIREDGKEKLFLIDGIRTICAM